METQTLAAWLDELLRAGGRGAQQRFAEAVSTRSSTVGRWRKGTIPDRSWVPKIAEAGGISKAKVQRLLQASEEDERQRVGMVVAGVERYLSNAREHADLVVDLEDGTVILIEVKGGRGSADAQRRLVARLEEHLRYALRTDPAMPRPIWSARRLDETAAVEELEEQVELLERIEELDREGLRPGETPGDRVMRILGGLARHAMSESSADLEDPYADDDAFLEALREAMQDAPKSDDVPPSEEVRAAAKDADARKQTVEPVRRPGADAPEEG